MKKIQLTMKEYQNLNNKLLWLKTIKLPNIISLIKKNYYINKFEYNVAREYQRICLKKIKEIELKLRYSNIILLNKNSKYKFIKLFTTVKLQNLKTKHILKYKIVAEDEYNSQDNTISRVSPLANMLLNRIKGEIIFLNTYLGIIKYKIIAIK